MQTILTLIDTGVVVPIDLLQRAFSGHADRFREDACSNQARNAMFELTMGAMAARGGLAPVLSISNPDVSFQFENRRVCMECKRVISESKVLTRIREGIKQLKKSVRSGTNDVGIVAISLSKLFNPEERVAVVPENIHPHDLLFDELSHILQRHEQDLGKLERPSVAAILFYLSSLCYVPRVGHTRASCAKLFPMNPMNHNGNDFLQRLGSKLIT